MDITKEPIQLILFDIKRYDYDSIRAGIPYGWKLTWKGNISREEAKKIPGMMALAHLPTGPESVYETYGDRARRS